MTIVKTGRPTSRRLTRPKTGTTTSSRGGALLGVSQGVSASTAQVPPSSPTAPPEDAPPARSASMRAPVTFGPAKPTTSVPCTQNEGTLTAAACD
jgi:hypothetical protein